MSVKYKPEQHGQFVEKINSEVEIIQDFFEEMKVHRRTLKTGKEKIDDLLQVLTGNNKKILQNIVNLNINLGDKFNDKCMKCLLRLRKDFTKKQKAKLMKLILKQEENIKQIKKKNLGKLFYRGIMTEFRIHQFVQKFRERKQKRDEIKRKKAQEKKDAEILQINENERLVNFGLILGN
jgi:hypothetical protein